jgi:hypothetical protein
VPDASDKARASRREEALRLAEELLGDIELNRLRAIDVVRKTSRLARLLDDAAAGSWLAYESGGYPIPLDDESSGAVARSHRETGKDDEGRQLYSTQIVSEIEQEIDGTLAQIAVAAGGGTSHADVALLVERDRTATLSALRNHATERRGLLDRIIGALYVYVSDRYQELRFGASVEGAFEVVRSRVDAEIADLVPEGLGMISAAFEGAASNNPEHWANAASTCRRLLKAAADRLRPAGQPIELESGKKIAMGPGNYVNRLVAWVNEQATSATAARVIAADLDYLGNRLDAVDAAGQKGAHDLVDRFDASRFITGTYLVLGDILRLRELDSIT